ncbi:UrvD/REP family ATP-dependent DNA helicase [Sanguibacter sp. HDW7]|uniref:UrvD/REP family ATP-dependent DNA helicase n=1 Tax=Sanguibacter sp. HDW7 TaxID=2714931 RepID=UPI0014082814|nr:UrvD/REP family ATP-dependent DNA helicase [Sanguibacter sp. HDW7]QIK84117.1 ATP-dependent helicase [Sanguibacter sp. HDW7]
MKARLAPADAPLVLAPDAAQDAAVALARTARALLVTGAPGTGRTTTTLRIAADHLVPDDGRTPLDPSRVLVVAASRRGAGQIRDRLAALTGRTVGAPLVRTAPSVAHAILRRRAAALEQPAPTLISGPEQDLVLAELLEGHLEGEGTDLTLPPGVPPEALRTRGFRDELRDVLMRAAERGLDPVALDELGVARERPAWRLAARLMEEYQDVMALRTLTPDLGERVDPASVVHEAVEALLAWDDEVPQAERPRWDLVVVDDYQEATQALARLCDLLLADGARLVLLGDPDLAVQGFRGAVPGLVAQAAAPRAAGSAAFGAEHVVLGTVHRHGSALREVTARVASLVGAVGTVAHRRAESAADAPEARGSVRTAILDGPAQEHAYVAHALRSWHLRDGLPWSQMVVLARSGGQVAALRRALTAASVPVTVLGSEGPLRDEPAVRPLLDAVEVASGAELDADRAVALLLSPIGGLDVVGLRRLRRALRAEELSGGGTRASDALLCEVLADPVRTEVLPSAVRRAPARVARVLARGREAAALAGADAQTVLWAVWDATGLAPLWRDAALGGGAAGARADRDLDAVLALFKAAEWFVERNARRTPGMFVDHVRSQELPADSLAQRGGVTDAVSVLTPAGAAGREWRAVVVAGVQEGVWPDLRLRDTLLGAQALVDAVAGQDVADGDPERLARARRAVLSDEVRALLVAVSRTREHLLVTAVSDTEQLPSVLLDLVEPPDPDLADDAPDPRRREAPVALDLRGLVLRARRLLQTDNAAADVDDATAEAARTEAADVLALLADMGVGVADPAGWYGTHDVSSIAPAWGPDDRVRVSPSKVEQVHRCALRWALEASGGRPADAVQQSLGTLVHAVAEAYPSGTFSELVGELERRWPELGLRPGWPETTAHARARTMVDRLAQHVASSGEVLATEARFATEVGRADLVGSVDRLVRQADGSLAVEDLKTGAAGTAKDAEVNPQLGAYQVALEAGAFGDVPGVGDEPVGGGARLVHVGGTAKGPSLREQPPLAQAEDPGWARALVEGAATTMAAATFTATRNSMCDFCPVRRSCPLQEEGRTMGGTTA